MFLDPRAETFYRDWDRAAAETVAILRWAVGRDPRDRDLSDLRGELATQSETFRTRWAAHNVRFHAAAVKHVHHHIVGELDLSFNRLDLAADPGLTIFTYTAEPGSRSEDALKLLGSWTATVDPPSRRVRPTRVEADLDMRQPEAVEIAGQPHDADLTGTEATAAAIIPCVLNRTA